MHTVEITCSVPAVPPVSAPLTFSDTLGSVTAHWLSAVVVLGPRRRADARYAVRDSDGNRGTAEVLLYELYSVISVSL